MIDIGVLENRGCTTERLREIFTSKAPDAKEAGQEDAPLSEEEKNYRIRKRFEETIQARITDGVMHAIDNGKKFEAVDLAWDSFPVQRQLIPLTRYAQGLISFKDCVTDIKKLDTTNLWCDYGDKDDIARMSKLRLYETPLNIMRSYVVRRAAAQSDRYDSYPFLKYDPLGTQTKEKLMADALTQRAEIMANQFGYKNLWDQAIREMFLYAKTVLFPVESWRSDAHWHRRDIDPDAETGASQMESRIIREGVEFVTVHPSRLFWERTAPLSALNYDLGPEWLGYWDIRRYGDLLSTDYWNKEEIWYSNALISIADKNKEYLQEQSVSCRLNFPQSSSDVIVENDRKKKAGLYTSKVKDETVYVTQYFCKINPKEEGIADYPFPVWVRLVIGGDCTVVYGEFMPSLPAVYLGYNEHGHRSYNASFAQEIMVFQDHISNILSHLLMRLKMSLMAILAIDTDAMSDDEETKKLQKTLESKNFYVEPIVLKYSGFSARSNHQNTQDFIRTIRADMQVDINNSFQAIERLISLVDRLQLMSAHEAAQVSPREITASEVQQLANTTNALYNYISRGIDEARAAFKRVIYESLINCARQPLRVPVVSRYPPSAVKEAGFEIDGAEDTDSDSKRRMVIVGNPAKLQFYYNFNTRDGISRASNQATSQALVQLLQIISQEPWPERLGIDKMMELVNEIARTSGAGFDLNLQEDAPDEDSGGGAKEMRAQIADITRILAAQRDKIAALQQAAGMAGGPQQQQQPRQAQTAPVAPQQQQQPNQG